MFSCSAPGGSARNIIPHLCGLGVGRLTLLDRDGIESRNYARQYLFRWADIGRSKVERAAAWVADYDPTVRVEAVERSIDGPAAIDEMIQLTEPDLVLACVDDPPDVDIWMNTVCVGNNVPYIRGGMYVTQGIIWSVDPGRSACRDCAEVTLASLQPAADEADSFAAVDLYRTKSRTNRGIGPVAGVLGSLVSSEALRYLTRFEEPAYAGAPLYIDFAAGCATEKVQWQREATCPPVRESRQLHHGGDCRDFRTGTDAKPRRGGKTMKITIRKIENARLTQYCAECGGGV